LNCYCWQSTDIFRTRLDSNKGKLHTCCLPLNSTSTRMYMQYLKSTLSNLTKCRDSNSKFTFPNSTTSREWIKFQQLINMFKQEIFHNLTVLLDSTLQQIFYNLTVLNSQIQTIMQTLRCKLHAMNRHSIKARCKDKLQGSKYLEEQIAFSSSTSSILC
jgi:hypothetical protein